MNRREFIYGVNGGLGALAFHSMLRADEAKGPLAPKVAHFPQAKAKRCIFLYMAGGPSHIDTFDPKPKLAEMHLQKFKRSSKFLSAMGSGERYYVQSPFKFRKTGQSGLDLCEHWEHLAGVADELCVYRGCQAESINHPTANYHMNTGNRFGGDPAIGSWVTYGLGSENRDLAGFVVLPEVAYPQGGAANWSNGFLPPHYQGTTLRAKGSPILDLHPPKGVTREQQRSNLDLLAQLNKSHAAKRTGHKELAARMDSYELAYRMQMKVPGILDLGQEKEVTREAYGLNDDRTKEFGRRLLLSRRLLERGDGKKDDLNSGRDHNKNAMPIFLAGGGVKKGHIIGATDEIGETATEVVHPIRDFHITLLRLLGLDDNKLTYFHGGRFKQLSQTGGELIKELIA